MRKRSAGVGKCLMLLAAGALTVLVHPPSVSAQAYLGTSQSFAVLAHETVTNAHVEGNPTTRVYGNVGVTPGTSVTGFYPDGTVTGGTIHRNDEVAQLALQHAVSAYNTLAGLPYDYNYTGFVLGSPGYTTLTPGVYRFSDSAQLTGALTLDFQGNPDASFIFQIGSTLTTASNASVNIINGGALSGVYWQVGSSAALGSASMFAGNILANASVSLDPTAKILCGRAFGLTGAVTLIDNDISNDNTAENFGHPERPDWGSYGYSGGGSPAPVPEPSTLLLLGSGLAGLVVVGRRFKRA